MPSPWLIPGAVNLALPGGGLIVVGAPWRGVLSGATFAVAVNGLILAVWLTPDDFAPLWRALLVGATLAAYLTSHVWLARVLRVRAEQSGTAERARVLRDARAAELQGDRAAALRALQQLAAACPDDALVAFRLAEVLQADGQDEAAATAWERLRGLDRHGLYRAPARAAAEARRRSVTN